MIKRINPIFAGLLAAGSIALALPTAAVSHPSGGPQSHEMRGGERGGSMLMLRGLDLTQEQRDQVFKIFHEQTPTIRSRMQAAREAQQALRQSALSPNFDSARARELADAAAKAHADVALMRAESMSKVFALLTPEQRTKLEQTRERHGRR